MVRRSNRKYHDRVAGRYDDVYRGEYWQWYREISWRHARKFLPEPRPARAADLGCGTGWFGVRLLRAGLATVFADPSGNMLGRAQESVEAESAARPEATFVQAGLESMPEIADASLDFATAQGDPLSFCEDPKRALRELHRCVRPGGGVVLSVDSRVAGVRAVLGDGQLDQGLGLLRTGRTQWRGERAEERFPMKMFLPDELDDLLRQTGFEPLSRIAKTCLVQRRDEAWLEDRAQRRRLLEAEERVHGRPEWFALAGHFQVAARRG